ncbi:MAG TPA: S41 family peptidase [Candidatus Methylomirabilis sp.]|jgi:carboxyl-terminal processing protease|nr:S41 family peptidase [Candidatus Methylomirabilis sp.]
MGSQRWRGKARTAVVGLALILVIIASGARHGVVATDEAYEKLKVFTEVLTLIQANYVEEVHSKDLVYGAIRGMLETLDPHSSFMPPEVYREMQVETQGSFGGLGIEITVRDRQLTVVSPIEGTPADQAGILTGDRIVKINGEPTKDMTLIEAVRKLRGPRGSQVTITIMREGFTEGRDFAITREIIEVHSVRSFDLGDKIGYIRLGSFQEKTARDLERALEQFQSSGAQALVLDLRNNPGGLLSQAVQVADLFLKKGQLIVYTEGRARNQDLRFSAEHTKNLPQVPMVLLVNGGSASASEIVAGALQDHKRAVILGTTTFGKGSVQTVIPLNDGSGLRLTTAKYFTPRGETIHGKGITPDILVEPPKPTVTAQAPPRPEGGPSPRERKIGEEEGDTSQPLGRRAPDLKADIQLARAVDILKANLILDRGGTGTQASR